MSFRPDQPDPDLEVLRDVLADHPVRLAVLFGSAATGETHPRSDLDVAVEFTDPVEDVAAVYLPLLADLSSAVERNDVDLSLVSDLKPRVGLAAFGEGVMLVGDRERMELHRKRFARAVAELENNQQSLRERLDAAIEGVDSALTEQS